MEHSKGLILLCILATVGLMGCPDDDDDVIPGPPGPAQAEAAIQNAHDTLVDPLVTAIEALRDYIDTLSRSSTRATCPDTSSACMSGTLSCSPTTAGWDFAFSDCNVVDASPTLILDGGAEVTVTGASSFILGLTDLSVNGSAGLNGTVTFADDCHSSWGVTSDGSHVTATIIACSDETPQAGSQLLIQIQNAGQWIINFTFDGSSTATALVTVDSTPIALCTVDLETFDANCSDPI